MQEITNWREVFVRITTVRSKGLSHLSYLVTSMDEAMVIDPRRDAAIYAEMAKEQQVSISHIFETHRNEDYVIGSLELRSYVPEVKIGHSKRTKFGYGDLNIADGDQFTVGSMRITCANTPGHTMDSICYICADESVSKDPLVVFTGDTLFVNSVGRTDLVDISRHEEMSNYLYDSLHEKLLTLPDGVCVHPGHGAGSVCGGEIGEREFTSIGYERKHNPWLSLTREEFVEGKLNQGLTRAPYFKNCEHLNTVGPPLLTELGMPLELDVESFDLEMQKENHYVIDTRPPKLFMIEHIPCSISLGLKNMGKIAGWPLVPSRHYLLVLHNSDELYTAWSYLVRMGFDNIIGYLGPGLDEWKSKGKSTDSLSTISSSDLKDGLESGDIQLVDTREPHELGKDTIEGSRSAALTTIETDLKSLDPTVVTSTICPTGYRSTTAASILKCAGFPDVRVAFEGLKAWKEKGFPVKN
jgi:hydroxyacylglutathione hydrolase